MTLDILVNHYNESEDIVKRFLSSLEMQKDVEYNLYICSDGGEGLSEEFLEQFNLNYEYQHLPHIGVCATRNFMLDTSKTDYVMFCDIDDVFTSSDGLYTLMTAAEETKANIIGSPYLCETLVNNKYYYKVYEKDIIRVHGKIFRREYLLQNDIWFPSSMETSGDMYFLWLAYALTDNFVWINNNFYTWKWNPNSVTRHIKFHEITSFNRTLECYTLLARNVAKRNIPRLYDNLIATTVSMIYLETTNPMWKQLGVPKSEMFKAYRAAQKYLQEFYEYYCGIDKPMRKSRYDLMLNYKSYYKKEQTFDNIDNWARNLLQLISLPDDDEGGILIIGKGVVGSNLEKEISVLKPEIYDKFKNIDTRTHSKYKIAFICVDTPKTDEVICDITQVRAAIEENDAHIYVIKSTVVPGTTKGLAEEYEKNIIFSPEYYGGTQHCNNYDFNFTILGGDMYSCMSVIQVLQKVYDARHQFKITNAKTAELAKYMENAYLATKVSFCRQFWEIANQLMIPYEELRELFILDPRVEPAHTYIYRDQPYWESHCLDKDVSAIAEMFDAELLKSVIEYNEKCKNKKEG